MDHVVEGPDGTESAPRAPTGRRPRHGRHRTRSRGRGCGWSSSSPTAGRASARSPALRDEVDRGARPRRATRAGTALLDAQRAYLDEFWDRADVEIEGDLELQQAVRFALFHTLQAGARAEQRAIAAKGLTGPGYDGHTFWDTERFVLPVLTYTAPETAADALRWRHATLDLARERADQLGLAGAAFPWRTIRGQECSGYWPAGTAAFHINADIADAVVRYHARHRRRGRSSARSASSCWSRPRGSGARSATTTPEGRFRIDGVTGPDEYSAIADNNVYTNLLAQRNLRAAADAVARHPRHAAAARRRPRGGGRLARRGRRHGRPLGRGARRPSRSPRASPTTSSGTSSTRRPSSTRCCSTSPTSTSTASRSSSRPTSCSPCTGAAMPSPTRRRRATSPTTRRITVRDSSLSACTQAVIAAEVGHLELAYDYFGEAALMDLHDLEHNTRRRRPHRLTRRSLDRGRRRIRRDARPRRPAHLRAPASAAARAPLVPASSSAAADSRSRSNKEEAGYTLLDGRPLEISHHGEKVEVVSGRSAVRPIPPLVPRPAPVQPHGRAPIRRMPG